MAGKLITIALLVITLLVSVVSGFYIVGSKHGKLKGTISQLENRVQIEFPAIEDKVVILGSKVNNIEGMMLAVKAQIDILQHCFQQIPYTGEAKSRTKIDL